MSFVLARSLLSGDGMRARALRGSMLTLTGFGGSMALRLASNLVLTRLLFPEAFGLVALVQVFLTGLQLFSDIGITPAILQNPRGDEPRFLNTAWVMEILRGAGLWLVTVAAAAPLAAFYDQPMLAQLLPVAGLTALVNGIKTTRLAHANRNLMLGRVTALELGSQALGAVVMIGLALATGSVWSLVIGWLVGETAKCILSHVVMPGPRNRFEWDWEIFLEVFHFGKFIFISSIAGFLINSADRAILGKFVSLGELGIYNIGYFLAFVPMLLTHQLVDRVLLPLYSMVHRRGGLPEDRRKVALARSGLAGAMMLLAFAFGLGGDWLVQVLYTEPYRLAGPILVLLSISVMPVIALNYYRASFVGAGHTKASAIQRLALAAVQFVLLYVGIRAYGLMGAIVAPGLAVILVYPLNAILARRLNDWAPLHDAAFLLLAALGAAVILWVNGGALAALM